MSVEKIILGDDRLAFARKEMPYIPNSTIDYVDDPDKLIEKVVEAENNIQYNLIISDLEYGDDKKDGLDVFRALQRKGVANDAKKILWTARADEDYVKEAVQELGIELLDKNQLGTLVGLSSPEAVLKKDGIVLLYVPSVGKNPYKSLKKAVEAVFDNQKIQVSDDLEAALVSQKYGLIIDASTLSTPLEDRERGSGKGAGVVAHDMKYIKVAQVPKVVTVRNYLTAVADIGKAAVEFYKSRRDVK